MGALRRGFGGWGGSVPSPCHQRAQRSRRGGCCAARCWPGITGLASLRAGKCELCFVSLPWQPVLMTTHKKKIIKKNFSR